MLKQEFEYEKFQLKKMTLYAEKIVLETRRLVFDVLHCGIKYPVYKKMHRQIQIVYRFYKGVTL